MPSWWSSLSRPSALVAVAVLLVGCGEDGGAAACNVQVDTAELVTQRTDAGIDDCPELSGDNDLPDVALPCLGSEGSMSLADIEGPAVVNFWSTTCVPCIKEMPVLAAFDEKYGDRVPVYGVNWLDTYPGAAIELAARTGASYPSAADPCGELQETDLVIAQLPQFVFVAEDGSFTQLIGGIKTVDELLTMVDDQLGIDLEEAT